MSFGSEFQTFGAATQNARFSVSVRVHSTERRGASVDRREDRVVIWRCRSSSMYGGTEDDRALRVKYATNSVMKRWRSSGRRSETHSRHFSTMLRYVAGSQGQGHRHVSALVDHYHNKEPINFLRNYRNKQIKGRKRVTFIEANSNTMK